MFFLFIMKTFKKLWKLLVIAANLWLKFESWIFKYDKM
jgi:hypothetical protein